MVAVPHEFELGKNASPSKINENFDALAAAFDAIFPAGLVAPFAGSVAPNGWLNCDGSAVSRTTFAVLFAAIGTAYGVGDGSSTFNLPDLRGRVVVGVKSSDGDFNALGKTGGQKDLQAHVHSIAHDHPEATTSTGGEHSHTLQAWPAQPPATATVGGYNTYAFQNAYGTTYTDAAGAHSHTLDVPSFSGTSGSSGSGASNMNPFQTLNYIIKF